MAGVSKYTEYLDVLPEIQQNQGCTGDYGTYSLCCGKALGNPKESFYQRKQSTEVLFFYGMIQLETVMRHTACVYRNEPVLWDAML